MAPKSMQTSKKEQVGQVKAIVKDLVDLAETTIKETPSPSRSRAGSTSDIELKLAREELEKLRAELATAALTAKEAESKLKVSQESMDKFSTEMQAAITRTETAQSALKLAREFASTESARAAELAEKLEVSKTSREADAKAAAAEIAKEREMSKSARAVDAQNATTRLKEMEAKHAAELDFEQSKVSFVAEELKLSKATREADAKNAAARLQDLEAKHVALLDMTKSKASSMAQELEASKTALEANLTELTLVRHESRTTAEELESLKKSMGEKSAESEKVMYCMTTKYDYQLSQVKDLKLSRNALAKEAAETTAALNGIKGTFAFKVLSAVGCSK